MHTAALVLSLATAMADRIQRSPGKLHRPERSIQGYFFSDRVTPRTTQAKHRMELKSFRWSEQMIAKLVVAAISMSFFFS